MVAIAAKHPARQRRERWYFTPEEDAALLECHLNGGKLRDVAIRLGRPPGSIHDRLVKVLERNGIAHARKNPFRRWTLDEEVAARKLYRETEDFAAVARLTGRTEKAVKNKLMGYSLDWRSWAKTPKLGAPPSPAKLAEIMAGQPGDRVCLRCRKTFRSTHAGNRICGPCKQANESSTRGMPAHLAEADIY